MKLLVYPNLKIGNSRECTIKVVEALIEYNQQPIIMDNIFDLNIEGCIYTDSKTAFEKADAVIAIGGDGSIFHCAGAALSHDLPILGVNAGRLGFLSQLEIGDLSPLKHLEAGEYEIKDQMVLMATVTTEDGEYTDIAINDIVLSRAYTGRIADLEVSCNGDFVGVYRADGLIFATPTGSTAYSLSAGGPIVDPELDCIILTPICPHSLFARTIMFSDTKILEVVIKMPDHGDKIYVSVDGKIVHEETQAIKITIKKYPKASRFLCLNGKNFYQTLNKKLKFRGYQQ